MKTKLKWLLWIVLVAFVLLQFVIPVRTNPLVSNDFISTTHPPATVAASLRVACYDCHSNNTIWPWYSRVAPVSWLIISDVNDGRNHVNFSEWPKDPDTAVRRLGWIYEVLAHNEMPPPQYTLLHAGARLTNDQHQQLLSWLKVEMQKQMAAAVAR